MPQARESNQSPVPTVHNLAKSHLNKEGLEEVVYQIGHHALVGALNVYADVPTSHDQGEGEFLYQGHQLAGHLLRSEMHEVSLAGLVDQN